MCGFIHTHTRTLFNTHKYTTDYWNYYMTASHTLDESVCLGGRDWKRARVVLRVYTVR